MSVISSRPPVDNLPIFYRFFPIIYRFIGASCCRSARCALAHLGWNHQQIVNRFPEIVNHRASNLSIIHQPFAGIHQRRRPPESSDNLPMTRTLMSPQHSKRLIEVDTSTEEREKAEGKRKK